MLRQDPALTVPIVRRSAPPERPVPAVPVPVTADGESPSGPGRHAAAGHLVGRAAELAEIDRVVAEVIDSGRGRIVLISGDPGIGKSRLLESVIAGAGGRGLRVGVGRCEEDGGTPALWPWTQACAACWRPAGSGSPRRTCRTARARSAPTPATRPGSVRCCRNSGIPRRCGGTPTRPPSPSPRPSSPASPRSARRCSHSTTSTGPTAIRFACCGGSPASSSAAPACWCWRCAAPRGTSTRMRRRRSPPSLGCDPCGSGSAGSTPMRWRRPSPAGTDSRCARTSRSSIRLRTDGNPFYVGELADLLVSEGLLHDAGAPARLDVPDGVRDVVRRRLDRLPNQARIFLSVAAVAGRSFDADLVQDAAGQTDDDADIALEAAQLTGLVVADGDGRSPLRARAGPRHGAQPDPAGAARAGGTPTSRSALQRRVAGRRRARRRPRLPLLRRRPIPPPDRLAVLRSRGAARTRPARARRGGAALAGRGRSAGG